MLTQFHSTKAGILAGESRLHLEAIEDVACSADNETFTKREKEKFCKDTKKCENVKIKNYKTVNAQHVNINAVGGALNDGQDQAGYLSTKPVKKSTVRWSFKNLFVLGFSFMCVYTAFSSLQGLQSTVNHHNGIGVASLSCIYGATVVSCLASPWIIQKLTTKWTIVISFSLFLVYIATNFYPKDFMLIPASVLLGLLTGPLWSAQSTYTTTAAISYAQTIDILPEQAISKFNGIFNGIFQTCHIWGNIFSAMVLSNNDTIHVNTKHINENRTGKFCAAKDCGKFTLLEEDMYLHIAETPPESRYMLVSIFLCCAALGVICIIALLDRNSTTLTATKCSVSGTSSQDSFSATLKLLRDPRLQLLTPLLVFMGLEQAFIYSEFTKAYVNCPLGLHNVGFIMTCFGTVNALSCFLIGFLSRQIKRYCIMLSGAIFTAGLLIVLLLWVPSIDDIIMFYVVVSCLGICDAIWVTQTNTLFGVLFPDDQEAAFSNYRMFQAIGLATAFGYSYFLCVRTKVLIMCAVMVISLGLYTIVELRLRRRQKHMAEIIVL
ncbi:unnamed protein product [Owenia fusiformis]|uniref:Uncharacterized protein n=1 Tax=Owenia fusiformis TaxID=6347 RepID=A0A8J1YA73_OWEFU|nr:unnamed protein product [Owenia fusiformis]